MLEQDEYNAPALALLLFCPVLREPLRPQRASQSACSTKKTPGERNQAFRSRDTRCPPPQIGQKVAEGGEEEEANED